MSRKVFPRTLTLIIVALAVALLPYITGRSYYLFVINYVLVYFIAIVGLNLIWGYAGLLSLGHPAFAAISAYTTGLLMLKMGVSFWLALPAGLFICGLCAIFVGIPVLRLKGHHLAVATFCLTILVEAILVQWEGLTGGSVGLIGLPKPSLFGHNLHQEHLFYIIMPASIFIWLLFRNLICSPMGNAIKAIRDSEEAAASVGINVTLHKILVFVVGCVAAGFAGSFHIVVTGYVNPQTVASLELLLLFTAGVVVGGAGTLSGPIWGTLFIVLLPELLTPLKQYMPVVFGIALAATVLLAPGGIASLFEYLQRRFGLYPLKAGYSFRVPIGEK